MEHIGYSILCINLFILFIFYIGGDGWVGRGGKEDVLWEIWNGELAVHVCGLR